MNGLLDRRTMIGLVAWVGYLAWSRPSPLSAGWGEALLLFGPTVLMPTALRLAAILRDDASGTRPIGRLSRFVERAQTPAALLLTASFGVPIGSPWTWLAVPWIVTLELAALDGLIRLVRRPTSNRPARCVEMASLFLIVSGFATGAYHEEAGPFGFDPAIMLLTGVHFLYAGYFLPLTAASGRSPPRASPSAWPSPPSSPYARSRVTRLSTSR